jgi:hypothetical protein
MPLPHGSDRAHEQRDGTWVIVAPAPKGWRARRPRNRISPEHPGTAVSWDGKLFEVVAARESSAGEARYSLERWQDRHTIRVIENYDEAAEERRALARIDDARRRQRRRELLLLSPLAGHLPAEVQDRWEHEYDVPASLITIVSALPLFVFGVLCSLSLTIRAFTGVSLLPLPSGILILGLYLMLESGMRLSAAWGEGRPAGSLIGTVAWEMGRRLAVRRSPKGAD